MESSQTAWRKHKCKSTVSFHQNQYLQSSASLLAAANNGKYAIIESVDSQNAKNVLIEIEK